MAVGLDFEIASGGAVMGVDEAGRGPLAGGVYAAAVSVEIERAKELLVGEWREINDSKKLSEKKRERLAEIIKNTSGCRWAIACATAKEIDELNILNATHLAMRRAAEQLGFMKILVDGLPVKSLPYPSQNIIKGDAKSLFIAAASILAKTARDAELRALDAKYPQYGFAKHKGYPTKAHYEAIEKFGITPEHRKSFRLCAK